jgi:hypothetical protein
VATKGWEAMNYEMSVMDEGITIKGPIPMDQFGNISKMAKSIGFDILDVGLANALGVSFVLTNQSGSEVLRNRVAQENKCKNAKDAWICGCDTGTSSKTIFSVMTGSPTGRADIPYDPDDFGRCYRLLKLIPEWRQRLGEVSEKYSKWIPLVEHWDELTDLYESGLSKDDCHKLYTRMQELLK